ncbi:calcyphosin isoform X2 [Monodon monoceros]|uniref:calcyphosin isoform X2 n=1 Tax=Monodon monoceros TaxID=40151 RepID=UPI0010F6A00A|nr:calcyphosin isoform X2 [Monodon monoceros]
MLRAMRLWCLESYSWGPSQSPGYRPLATARPGRTHCQRWAEQAEGKRSGYPDSRTDEGQISLPSSSPGSPDPSWMLWTPPWRSSGPSACPEGPRASRAWPGELSPHTSPTPRITFQPRPLPPRFFRRMDRDRSRSLDAGELQRGLAELGLVLDTAEAQGVCRRWDRDSSETLDLEEFLRALRPPMSQVREAVITAAFAKLDRSGNGVVTVDDLRGVYSGRAHPRVRSGEWTEEEVLRRFLDNFDSSEKDGQVTLAEFQDYYSGVSASVDTDEEFVAMMTSAWQLKPGSARVGKQTALL